MNYLYPKPLTGLKWMGLCLLLIFVTLQSKAQTVQSSLKMVPGQGLQKIGPELATLAKEQTTTNKTAGARSSVRFPVNRSLLQIKENQIIIQALAENNTDQLLSDLKALGLTHSASYGRVVSGLIPIATLDKVAALKSLRSARPAYKPATKIGKATTQGDRAVYADSARKQQVVNGKGTKVGIISDSYNSLGEADKGIRSGDLPGKNNPNGYKTPIQVLLDEAPFFGTDEGRAMAEIVHDVAPAAEMAFYSANFGQASFAQGILDLQKAGCNVIVDDVLYFDEPMFQDGIIAQAIDAVKKDGTSYFTAAGNQGRDSYQAAYKAGGVAHFGSKSSFGPQKVRNAHNFAPAGRKKDITQRIHVPVGTSIILAFQYSEPFYSAGNNSKGAQSDLDVYLLTEDTTDVVTSSTNLNKGNDPYELLTFFNDGSYDSNFFNILIDKYEGASPSIIKYVLFKDDMDVNSIREYNTRSSTIYGHNNAAGAITTGAVFFLDTPAYGIEDPVAEIFSSAGGTPIIFDENGKPRTRLVRRKPEIMATDGGSNTFFGTSFLDEFYFYGTSAAAPHAAAVAALMQEANGNNLSPDQVKTTLQQTAQDMSDPGFDFDTGYGLINAVKALDRVSIPRVREFNLVDADSRKTIKRLQEGEVINLTRLPTRNVFIYARTGPTHVGSVFFDVNGNKTTENKVPYNYPGSTDDFFKITEGNYTITAVPYTQTDGKGGKGVPLTLNFRVVEEKIIRFELFNVNNGSVLRVLEEGDELNLANLPANLNIRAVTNPVRVGS
ncbi:MAG: S8 family serine peptidase, partial [Bacteroidota bacterium]|nr:S8 family serine peptidase [Bacteroidota bacterium]